MNRKNKYRDLALGSAERVIGQLNRNRTSPLYGCFDRSFWHYNVVDFSCARMQEGVLYLALLYALPDSQYYKNKELLEWIKAAVLYWVKIQNKDGSFNEWYPQEHSFVATAFSAYAISEAMLILKDELDWEDKIVDSIKRAGQFLISRKEVEATNQNSGAIATLYNIYLITGEAKYRDYSGELLSYLQSKQEDEGWFKEYGGADIGYLYLTVDYLAKYFQNSQDDRALAIAEKAFKFLEYFVHPDGTVGGVYGSRNTSYAIPFGLEFWADKIFSAGHILQKLCKDNRGGLEKFFAMLDDRYLLYNGYTYLQAYFQVRNDLEKEVASTMERGFVKEFPAAGLVVINQNSYYLVCNYKKGGVLYFFNRLNDQGSYEGGLNFCSKSNKCYISAFLGCSKGSLKEDRIIVGGSLVKSSKKTPSFLFILGLRFFSILNIILPYGATLLKKQLRRLFITSRAFSGFKFNRTIIFSKNYVEIKDSFLGNYFKLAHRSLVEDIYVPSSRYFTVPQLNSNFNYLNIKELNLGVSSVNLMHD